MHQVQSILEVYRKEPNQDAAAAQIVIARMANAIVLQINAALIAAVQPSSVN